MFFVTDSIPSLVGLQSHWLKIRSEFDCLPDNCYEPWRERHIYNGDWHTLMLVDGYQLESGRIISDLAPWFPTTLEVLNRIPSLLTAGFSRLGPSTAIFPHRGFDPHVLRIHLGLRIPQNCWLEVRGQLRRWEEGELLAFDDTYLHQARNNSLHSRIVLLVDIMLEGPPGSLFKPLNPRLSSIESLRHGWMLARYFARKVFS